MLEPNRHLRVARSIRDTQASFLPRHSHLVRRIGWSSAAAALGFALCTLLALLAGDARGAPPIELAVFGVSTVATGLSALLLLTRRRPAYYEAKVSAQLLLLVGGLTVWGLGFGFSMEHPLAAFGQAFSSYRTLFSLPYVWISIVVGLGVFNRWFARVVDQEIEEQRD